MKKEGRMGIRVSHDLYSLVYEVSSARGESISGFVRRVVLQELARLSFLPEEQKKALGVQVQDTEEKKELEVAVQ